MAEQLKARVMRSRASDVHTNRLVVAKKKTAWVEIELVGEDGKPILGEKYCIELPDGSIEEGTLDATGRIRFEGIKPGTCKVSFPELDQDAWESR